ncbi:LysR substrate-binding domain-containing protein [Parapusillimonas sp. JC17]|uniref:LysR substrate-binding domain-containing protein n=1 Tax=Parapusillimonas sp. JC17 TaxID=3445768 RepID=UPI003F9F98F5
MKDHSLRALLAVAEAGTIRGAARALNLSQAALTKSLRELESDIGAELLSRSYRGVRLTEAGRILHDRAKVARQQLQIAEAEIRALSGSAPERLAVGVTPMVALSVLSDVWTHFRRLRPAVALNLREGLPSIVVPALLKGELDFAVVMADPGFVPDTLAFEPIIHTSFQIVGRAGHPARHATELAQLLDYEWIFSLHPGSYSERILKWIADQGLAPPQRIVDCNSTLSNWQLIRNSDMLTMLPSVFFQAPSIAAESHGLMRFGIRLPEAVVGSLRLKHAPPSSAATLLADLFALYLRRQGNS